MSPAYVVIRVCIMGWHAYEMVFFVRQRYMSVPPPHSIHRDMIGRIGSRLLISLLGQLQEGIIS